MSRFLSLILTLKFVRKFCQSNFSGMKAEEIINLALLALCDTEFNI